eukprot:scaffold9000_cov139-Isochrysis_galbana.AAC.6
MENDVHVLDTATWTWIRPAIADGPAPTPRAGAAAAAAGHGTFVICCGAERSHDGQLRGRGDVWALILSDDASEARWELLLSEEDPLAPRGRNAHSLVSLGVGNGVRMLLHGGWQPFVRTFDDSLVLTIE